MEVYDIARFPVLKLESELEEIGEELKQSIGVNSMNLTRSSKEKIVLEKFICC